MQRNLHTNVICVNRSNHIKLHQVLRVILVEVICLAECKLCLRKLRRM